MWKVLAVTVSSGSPYNITQNIKYFQRPTTLICRYKCPCGKLIGTDLSFQLPSVSQAKIGQVVKVHQLSGCGIQIDFTCEFQQTQTAQQRYAMPRQRYSNYYSTKEAELLYQESIDSYKITFSFDKDIVNFIKMTVPSHERSWDADLKAWFVHEKWYDLIKQVLDGKGYNVKSYTKQNDIDMKKKVEEAARNHNYQVAQSRLPSEKELLNNFIAIMKEVGIGLDIKQLEQIEKSHFQKLYRHGALALHPDKNPTKAHLMSDLNVAWDGIKKVIFKENALP